jgi:hypothetical protein
MKHVITMDEINNMTDEERAALNKKLERKIMIRVAAQILVPIAVVAVARVIEKRYDKNHPDED